MYMKKLILMLLTILLILPVSFGLHHESEQLQLDVTISSEVDLFEKGMVSFDFLEVKYQLDPITYYRQNPSEISFNPPVFYEEDSVVHRFETYRNNLLYQASFQTINSRERVKIREKVSYPIEDIDPALTRYIQESGLINIDSNIRRTASDLARNEDDLFKVAVKIADWVNNNVQYNLSTLSEEAEKESTWVFENRQGVCTEISNLYISMLRSLGIPSRFVTGIAYTESELFESNWGLHGWVEVYFPNHGWVPFDPTYGQNGYVDATHISLEKGVEGNTFNTNYRWRGRGFDVTTNELDIDVQTTVLQEYQDELEINVDLEENLIGFGSYNIVQATVTNGNDYYIAERIMLGQTNGLEYINNREQEVVLEPNEQKTVRWVIRVDQDQSSGFSYTFPIVVQTANMREETSFSSSERGRQIDAPNIQEDLPPNMIYCFATPQTTYIGESIQITCDSSLIGLKEVCVNNNCQQKNVQQEFTINYTPTRAGFKSVSILADEEKSHATLNVLDEANISFVDQPNTLTAQYGEVVSVESVLERTSSSVPQNITIQYIHDYFTESITIDRLESRQQTNFNFNANMLKTENNDLEIKILYQDELGKQFEHAKTVSVEFEELTFLQKIRLYLNFYRNWV